jgi:hypothetical protein
MDGGGDVTSARAFFGSTAAIRLFPDVSVVVASKSLSTSRNFFRDGAVARCAVMRYKGMSSNGMRDSNARRSKHAA